MDCLFQSLSSTITDRRDRKYPLKWQWFARLEVVSPTQPKKEFQCHPTRKPGHLLLGYCRIERRFQKAL